MSTFLNQVFAALCFLPTALALRSFDQNAMGSAAVVSARATEEEEGEDSNKFWLVVAKGLGYVVGFGSLMLYTPVAIRLVRQKHADGLTISTWWLKVFSYLLSDIYFIRKAYDVSTYVETLVITVEATIVLILVAWYQHYAQRLSFWFGLGMLLAFAFYGVTVAPESLVATGQLASATINIVALFPQMHHNWSTQSKGDYSPLTAGLAFGGCGIRLFTTITLNGSDPVLIWTFGVAMLVNGTLLLQILYYGVVVEGWTLLQMLLSDFGGTTTGPSPRDPLHDEEHGVASDTTPISQSQVHHEIPLVVRKRSIT